MRTILRYLFKQTAKIFSRSFIIFLPLIATNEMIFGQGLMSGKDKVFKYVSSTPRNPGLNVHYLEIGAGVSLWYLSRQEGMQNQKMPFHIFIEKGKIQSPLSVMASYNFNGTYQLQGFQLKPQYVSLQAKYSFTRLIPRFPANVNVYGTAGVTGWKADLDNSGAGQSNDTGQIESGKGIGYVISTGISYYFRQFALGAQLLYFSGKGDYSIGDLENIETFTGSTQLNITLSYQFLMGRGKVLCPIYKR